LSQLKAVILGLLGS